MVPRGAGTGLTGDANAVSGSAVLDLSRMNQVLKVDPYDLVCVEQPCAVNNDIKAALTEQSLWYPPDPASAPWSTIGGRRHDLAGRLDRVSPISSARPGYTRSAPVARRYSIARPSLW